MATSDGITADDEVVIRVGSPAKFNWTFSKWGEYEVTFEAFGTLPDGSVTSSGDVTYFFQVGNTVEALDVQNGEPQRSFVRNVDLVFGQDDGLDDLLTSGRVEVTKFDLNGENGIAVDRTAYAASVDGARLRLDFGANGIGGNRNTDAGDGYYRIGVDMDGDGNADVFKTLLSHAWRHQW